MLSPVKRLAKEKAQLHATNDESVILSQNNPIDMRAWEATIRGPPDSFYEGYDFDLNIYVPAEYPMVPPSIKFTSKIFHPNVLYEVCKYEAIFP